MIQISLIIRLTNTDDNLKNVTVPGYEVVKAPLYTKTSDIKKESEYLTAEI